MVEDLQVLIDDSHLRDFRFIFSETCIHQEDLLCREVLPSFFPLSFTVCNFLQNYILVMTGHAPVTIKQCGPHHHHQFNLEHSIAYCNRLPLRLAHTLIMIRVWKRLQILDLLIGLNFTREVQFISKIPNEFFTWFTFCYLYGYGSTMRERIKFDKLTASGV